MRVSFPQKNNFTTLTANIVNTPIVNNPAGDLTIQRAGAAHTIFATDYLTCNKHVRLVDGKNIVGNDLTAVLQPDHTGGITSLADVANSPTFNGIPVTRRYLEGVANKAWVGCIFVGEETNFGETWSAARHAVTNLNGNSIKLLYQVPLPINLYGKELYLKNVRIALTTADAGDYITKVNVIGMLYGANSILNNDVTDIVAPEHKEYTFTAVSLDGYAFAFVEVECSNTDAGDLTIDTVEIEAYYNT